MAESPAGAKPVEGEERIVDGLGVSPGVAIGVAYVREIGSMAVPEYRIPAGKLEAEIQRLRDAVAAARRQLGRLRNKVKSKVKDAPDAASEELSFLLDAYAHMLKDSRLVRDAEKRIEAERINAEAAVQAELAEIAKSFQAMNDQYIAARLDDIREVANRLIRNLTKTPVKPFSSVPKGGVIITEDLTPADTAQLDPRVVAGFAAMTGGAQGHTAIMARALGLPAVLGTPGLLPGVRNGDMIVIDGHSGRVVINPRPDTLAAYRRLRDESQREKRSIVRLRRQPSVTRDGVEITLQANVELPMEMPLVNQVGAAGIGLLRSEFMFMNRGDLPSEEEQYQSLRQVVIPMAGRSVTVRTLDVGGDKNVEALLDAFGGEPSSVLGMRGIRFSLARSDILETQFRAILRVGLDGPVRILLPMVTTVAEVRRARAILARAARKLERRGLTVPDPLPPVGVMIEIPGAALSADALARASDFFAIGSNDLTMFTLAIDRADKQVAHLYDPLHPAVLRLIQFSSAAALRARLPVSICGEVAGDSRFTALLVGLGFRELSMTASNIPWVKQRIRDLDIVAAERRARLIMEQVDSKRIGALLDDFNGEG